MADQFAFLKAEWPAVYEAAAKVEATVFPEPRTACFYARRALELAVAWAFKYDTALHVPYQSNLSALIHEPTFKVAAGEGIFNKAKLINTLGNRAVHSNRVVQQLDALNAVRELFHVCYWLAHTYGRSAKPSPDLAFDPTLLPTTAPVSLQTVQQLRSLEAGLAEKDEQLAALLVDKSGLDDEIKRLQAEVTAAKKAAAAQPDTHDYSEAQTRASLIDALLEEAGWHLDNPQDQEYPVTGMPDGKKGRVDYVLWGNDGRPLGLVEAKRTTKSPHLGKHQASLYADCLEAQFGQRPVIFYTNGYQHWLWDDVNYPPRAVQGFLKKAELESLIQRRTTRRDLTTAEPNPAIVERFYQTQAIRGICESFENDKQRKALIVMATGAGKTRTVIALTDLLMQRNWIKRVLFLADRVALVKQATNAFKAHLPDAAAVNLIEEKDTEGRVYVSTYPTMMGLIDQSKGGERRFGTGHFDLIVIDEAHRSVYQKYRAIFDYFDSLLVGLTATPKDEIDFNTYGLFDLERGVPTYAYGLEEAVKDGFLVPVRAVSVPLKFQRQGITYDELPEEEKELWDAIEWDDTGSLPSRIEPGAMNKWLFNADTMDKVLAHLMTTGLTVAGGDRLGKTIIFAKNQAHAEFIAQRFDINYPHLKGKFAQVIHHGLPYAQTLIDNFSNPAKEPHIAISVDMLDTGIDVPEVANLAFIKMVRSKTKFWQMLGRGTRLCPDLFGPGKDKDCFYVLDYCQNLEFFSQNPVTTQGSMVEPLSKKLFKARLDVVDELDRHPPLEPVAPPPDEGPEPLPTSPLRDEITTILHTEVSLMNPDNFVVRPKRQLVEKYADPEAWKSLGPEKLAELAHEVAGLPTQLPSDDEDAKRFDLLILNLQLAMLRVEHAFDRLATQVKTIAGLLEEKSTIPMVAAQMPLILDVQEVDWWQDVTVTMLDQVRKRLRLLVKLIDREKRKHIYTDFEDKMGDDVDIGLPGFAAPDSFDRFRIKARAFLRAHEDQLVIHKLRTNQALTRSDLEQLERILAESGTGSPEDLARAKEHNDGGLGLFVRSLVGLDREAAKQAFSLFLNGSAMSANQIEFVNLIINQLTENGVMGAALLYESPFTELTPMGPEDLFTPAQVQDLVTTLDRVRETAVAA